MAREPILLSLFQFASHRHILPLYLTPI
jgi:hypothetical protein